MKNTGHEWKAAWHDAAFRVQMVVTVAAMAVILLVFSRFLNWIEVRPGVVLQDPVLEILHPYDFTWPIFSLIYASLLAGLVMLAFKPDRLMLALQSYTVMMCFRLLAMYVAPLDPPEGMIPLADPFVQFFGSGEVPTKDLFFSGHVSTLLILACTADGRGRSGFFTGAAIMVALMLVWQHVHYTVDVLVAPFMAYGSYRVTTMVHSRLFTS